MKLVNVLEEHRNHTVHVHIDSVIDMIADLRQVSRDELLQHAVMAWFYHALDLGVLEVECKEQPSTEDASGGLLVFRVRLDADQDQQVAALSEGVELGSFYRDELVEALPGHDSEMRKSGRLTSMVNISYAKA